jgi:NADH:ubiquinone oxidoreductase subunit K
MRGRQTPTRRALVTRLLLQAVVLVVVVVGSRWADTSRKSAQIFGPLHGTVFDAVVAAEAVLGLIVVEELVRTLRELHGRRAWTKRDRVEDCVLFEVDRPMTLVDLAVRITGRPSAATELWKHNAGRRLRRGPFARVLRGVGDVVPEGARVAIPTSLIAERDTILRAIARTAQDYAARAGAWVSDEPTPDERAEGWRETVNEILTHRVPELGTGLVSPLAGPRRAKDILPDDVADVQRLEQQDGLGWLRTQGWTQLPELTAETSAVALPRAADLAVHDKSLVARCHEPIAWALARDLAGLAADKCIASPDDVAFVALGASWALVVMAGQHFVSDEPDELRQHNFYRLGDPELGGLWQQSRVVQDVVRAARRLRELERRPTTRVLFYGPTVHESGRRVPDAARTCLVPVGWLAGASPTNASDQLGIAVCVNLAHAPLGLSGPAARARLQAVATSARERSSPWRAEVREMDHLVRLRRPDGSTVEAAYGQPPKGTAWHVGARNVLEPIDLALAPAEPPVAIYLLGPLRVVGAGRVLAREGLALQMLAMLAVHEELPSAEIARRLATDADQLRKAAHAVQKMLGQQVFEARPGRGACRRLVNCVSDWTAFQERLVRDDILGATMLIRGPVAEQLVGQEALKALREDTWEAIRRARDGHVADAMPELLGFCVARALILDPECWEGWRLNLELHTANGWDLGALDRLQAYIARATPHEVRMPSIRDLATSTRRVAR